MSPPETVAVSVEEFTALVELSEAYLALVRASRHGESTHLELAASIRLQNPSLWPEPKRRLYSSFVKRLYSKPVTRPRTKHPLPEPLP